MSWIILACSWLAETVEGAKVPTTLCPNISGSGKPKKSRAYLLIKVTLPPVSISMITLLALSMICRYLTRSEREFPGWFYVSRFLAGENQVNQNHDDAGDYQSQGPGA